MTAGIFGMIMALGFVALVAAGVALVLDLVARRLPIVLRSLVAGIIAVSLPVFLGAVLVAEQLAGEDVMIALIPLFIGGLILALVAGFPSAYFVAKRRARGRSQPANPKVFE